MRATFLPGRKKPSCTMVDPVCFSTDSRRYSSRVGPLLPASFSDRHRYPLSLIDARPPSRMMTEREPEIDQQPRKRIAVACGRCRKRKIRCSGDPGNGEPCTNCRNANAEPCQFLRVASQETPILHDRGSFSYDVETARNHHARQSAPFSPQFAHEMPDGLTRYPTPSSAGYQYASAARYYPTNAPWAAAAAAATYPDDVDYAAMGTYGSSCYAQEQAANPYSYRMAPAVAARPSPSHHHHHGAIYADPSTESAYPAVHRPTVSIEPSTMSLSSVAAALPPTMDRMLPFIGTSSSSKSLAVAATGYHHLDPVPAAYGNAKSASSSSPDGSPTDSLHDPSCHQYGAYDTSPVSAAGFTHTASLTGNGGGSNHREPASTGCGPDTYVPSTAQGSLFADTEPLSRSLPDYSVRSGHSSRRESNSYSLAGPHGYTMPPGPIPSPSIAGRGLHQAQAQAAAAAAASAYMVSGPNGAASTSDPSSSPKVQDAAPAAHSDLQRARAAPSLSAA